MSSQQRRCPPLLSLLLHIGLTQAAAAARSSPPSPFWSVAELFPRIFVLCQGARCARHRADAAPDGARPPFAWPPALRARVTILDADDFNARLAPLAALPPPSTRRERRAFHKLASLLLHTHAVGALARAEGVSRALVVEDDVAPMPDAARCWHAGGGGSGGLAARVAAALDDAAPWDVLRLGGDANYATTAPTTRRPARYANATPSCRPQCECQPAARGLCRVGAVAPAALARGRGAWTERAPAPRGACDIRNSEAYGVSARAFAAFAALHDAVVALVEERLRACAAAAAATERNGSRCPAAGAQGVASALYADFPWFDIWLPSALENVYFVPTVAQQRDKIMLDAEAARAQLCTSRLDPALVCPAPQPDR